jgi:hypothetical protein
LHNAGCDVGWEKRRNGFYFYTASRVGGRVVKHYVGSGPVAAAAAELAAIDRQRRADDRAAFEHERRETAAIDARLDELNELADLVARAALVAAGYRRHHRGEWRRKRVRTDKAA